MRITHKFLADVSSRAYIGSSKLKELGFDEVYRFSSSKTGTSSYICVHKASRQVVVTFRGTDDWKDVATNLRFLKVRTPLNREMHEGFLEAYNSVKGRLESFLHQLAGWDTYVAAHSLGGALACILALQSGVKFKSVVTFGQPRLLGTNGFENLSKYNVIRYVNKSDVIARIPTMGYAHSGETYYINSKGELRINPSSSYVFLDSVWKVWNWLKDHRMDNYRKAIALL